jgi:hypothetical protein
MARLKTLAAVAACGLGAYAVVEVLVILSRKYGFLQWLAS